MTEIAELKLAQGRLVLGKDGSGYLVWVENLQGVVGRRWRRQTRSSAGEKFGRMAKLVEEYRRGHLP